MYKSTVTLLLLYACPGMYQADPLSLSKLRGSGRLCDMWFLGLTRVNIPNGITIGSAAYSGLTVVTEDRPTDHHHDATPSVAISRSWPVLRRATRPKNYVAE